MKFKIYIAGPLTAVGVDYLKNVSNMMVAGEHIRRLGYSVYVPSNDLLMGVKFGYTDLSDYFENSQPWLSVSDAVYLCPGWSKSEGTLKEIALAESLGIPVFTDSNDLHNYFKAFKGLYEALEQMNKLNKK